MLDIQQREGNQFKFLHFDLSNNLLLPFAFFVEHVESLLFFWPNQLKLLRVDWQRRAEFPSSSTVRVRCWILTAVDGRIAVGVGGGRDGMTASSASSSDTLRSFLCFLDGFYKKKDQLVA